MHQSILWALFLRFLAKQGIPVLFHPPYSPDLSLGDPFLYLKLKTEMKGIRLNAVSLIQQTVMKELKAIWKEAFYWAFHSLHE
jgi:hypothetical protein